MPLVSVVLSPREMKEQREILRWTFSDLRDRVHVSRAQLCEYERGTGRLRDDQLEKIEHVLRKAMLAHGAKIAKLVAAESREREAVAI